MRYFDEKGCALFNLSLFNSMPLPQRECCGVNFCIPKSWRGELSIVWVAFGGLLEKHVQQRVIHFFRCLGVAVSVVAVSMQNGFQFA